MTISTSHIVRRRGDTKPVRVCVKDLVGSAEDIANATFMMTVGTEPYPATIGTALFEVTGVIYGPAADGIVDFAIEGGDEIHVGFYYFDVEMIDSTGIKDTILFGWYEVKQDKTKSDEEFEWTPLAAPNDGDVADLDGTVDIRGFTSEEPMVLVAKYQTRDTRRVIRITTIQSESWHSNNLMPWGPAFTRQFFPTSGFEFKVTGYFDTAHVRMLALGGSLWNNLEASFDSLDGTPAAAVAGGLAADGESFYKFLAPPSISVGGWTEAEWIVLGLRWDTDGLCYGMVKREADADDWKLMGPDTWPVTQPIFGIPTLFIRRADPEDAGSVADIWKYEWRRL